MKQKKSPFERNAFEKKLWSHALSDRPSDLSSVFNYDITYTQQKTNMGRACIALISQKIGLIASPELLQRILSHDIPVCICIDEQEPALIHIKQIPPCRKNNEPECSFIEYQTPCKAVAPSGLWYYFHIERWQLNALFSWVICLLSYLALAAKHANDFHY